MNRLGKRVTFRSKKTSGYLNHPPLSGTLRVRHHGRFVMGAKFIIVFGVALFLFPGVLQAREVTVYRYQVDRLEKNLPQRTPRIAENGIES